MDYDLNDVIRKKRLLMILKSNGEKGSLQTKENILNSAYQIFFEEGFENATLDKICKKANVTRGAAYWYFKNKTEIYKEVVQITLQKTIDSKLPVINSNIPFIEKVVTIIGFANENSNDYKFLQQACKTIENNSEFCELSKIIQEAKVKLFQFFKNDIIELQGTNKDIEQSVAIASLLYNYFEGMHSFDTPLEIKKTHSSEFIFINLKYLINNINS